MRSTALQRLETLLSARRLDGTMLQVRSTGPGTTLASSGVPSLDAALGGGWRGGELSEIVGPRSSGRTGLLVSTLAVAAAEGQVVALVDALDRFDPVSAVAAGLDLDRVLWVRGPAITPETARPALLEAAVQRSVRACDLIVRAGGFAIVALDFSDLPARALQGLPASTWMRIAHANEGRQTVCLLVGDQPIGRSGRGVSVHLSARSRWDGDSLQSRRLTGFDVRVRVVQARMDISGRDAPAWRTDQACG